MGKSMAAGGALEVVLSWAGAVQKAELFHGEKSRVVVGESADATFMLPTEVLKDELVLAELDGSDWVLRIPAGVPARVEIRDAGGERKHIDLATVACEADGSRRVRLTEHARADIDLGAFTFHVRMTDAPEKAKMAPVSFDRRAYAWLAASVAVHLVLLFSALMMPPDGHALSMDLTADQARALQYRLTPLEPVEPEPPAPAPESGNQQNGTSGAPSPGEAGTVGDQNHRENRGGVAVRGRDNRQLVPRTPAQVRETGILGALAALTAEMHDIHSPYGAENVVGMADRDLFGRNLSDPGIGNGTNGLNMIGAGRGGGCREGDPNCVSGGIGVGNLDTIGGSGTCTREQFDRLVQTAGRSVATAQCGGIGPGTGTPMTERREPRRPPPIVGIPETMGGLTREQVRRVVSLHRNEVSFCYERALIGRPDLAGRVSVDFMIQPSGAVQMSTVNGATTLNDSAVQTCVTNAVRRWGFPQSPSPTMVTYPFRFERVGEQ